MIELIGLSKWYGEVIGLNNVSATIGKGMTGLVGPNGAGKSTLMGLTTGQLRPSKGSIRVLGKSVWDNPAVLSQMGYCPEGDPFWPNLTGRQFVRTLAKISGLGGRQGTTAVDQAIDRTGMSKNADRPIKGYSKGMRQRIKIAQALVHQPRLLVLDEPFTGADPVGRHELGTLFKSLADDGVDVLISSHVLHEVEAQTQNILMIDHGRIVAQGDLQTVRRGMHNRPHAILIRVDRPRKLAAILAEFEFVMGIKIVGSGGLMVETTTPDKVYDRLPELILEQNLKVQEITAADENLEAVFGYLTQRSS